jgi:hypothetical protein
LRLDGLDTVTPEIAGILATHQGSLSLGLKSISPDVAEKLAIHDAWLNLDSLATIDTQSAALLTKHRKWLSLDGLTSLTPENAESLGHYNGDKLDLNGLESLELEAAKLLSNAKCVGIYLNGLKNVSPDVIQTLANGNYDLSFQGLEFIDSSCQQALDAAEKKLLRNLKHLLIRKSDQPLLVLDSYQQEGSDSKGESLSYLWKLRGQSVGHIGVRALHIHDGIARAVSEGVFPLGTKPRQSIEVQLQLKSLDEPLQSNENVFVAALSVAVNGITTNAEVGKKFTMLGDYATHYISTGGQRNYEDTIMIASSVSGISHPKTIESMTVASKKGVDYFVVILTWQPIAETNPKIESEASGI